MCICDTGVERLINNNKHVSNLETNSLTMLNDRFSQKLELVEFGFNMSNHAS